jgi:hypothetical protein
MMREMTADAIRWDIFWEQPWVLKSPVTLELDYRWKSYTVNVILDAPQEQKS